MRIRKTRTRLIPPVTEVLRAKRVKRKKKEKKVLKKKKGKGSGRVIDYQA